MRFFSSWPLATLLAGGLALPPPAAAQAQHRPGGAPIGAPLFSVMSGAPVITALSPTRNLRNAPRAANVAVTFDQLMMGGPSSSSSVNVISHQRGGVMRGFTGGTVGVSGPTITFDPTNDFKPGETVFVTVTTAARSSASVKLVTPRVHQFTAATGGTGTGTFVAPAVNPEASVGATPSSVAVGDVDGDGDLDLLTANQGDNTVSVRLNNGSGSFSGGNTVSAGTIAQSVVLGDVDSDLDLDLLVTNTGNVGAPGTTVSVRLNDGSGNFSGGSEVSTGLRPFSLAVGDLDGDGDLDLLATNVGTFVGTGATVSIRFNDGGGNFSGAQDVAVDTGPTQVVVGDVDGDGDLDLMAANSNNFVNTVSVRVNNGSGVFSGTQDVVVAQGPFSVATGDVDGDGDLDLVAANRGASSVSVRLNNGSGTFGGTQDISLVGAAILVLGDVDADGDLDLFSTASGNTVAVRLNDGAGNYSSGPSISVVNSFVGSLAVADVDGDGDLDLLQTDGGNNTVSVRINQAAPITDLIVSTPQSVSGTFNSVTVQAGGVATLTGPLTVNTALTVQSGGRLNTNCQPLTGPGTFTLNAGGTLGICDAAGIAQSGPTGAVQVTGARSFSPDALYVYNGTATQGTGSGLPPTVRELEIANGNGVGLSQAVAVTTALRLTTGTLTTGGLLTLLSTATRTACAVHAGGQTSGNVTVQRFVGGPTAGGYRHLSSPVQSTPVADLTTTGYAPLVNPAFNNLPYVAPPAASFPNIFGFDETRGGATPAFAGFTTGYFSPATTGTPLTNGRGYAVFMAGAQTPDFDGALVTGNVPQFLTVTGTNPSPNTLKAGWHLLGNPYAQPINWDLATAGNGPGQIPATMSGSISVFRTQGGNNGQYLTRQNGLGTLPNGEIPLGQGFFARATSATAYVFTNALRVEANPATVARPVGDPRPVIRLTLASTAPDAVTDETLVYAETGATPGEDNRFDGLRPGRNLGTVPTLASLIQGQEAAVNGLPLESLTTGQTVVELTAALPTAGTYTLTAADVANLPTGTTVALLDRQLNITQPLTGGTTYQLTAPVANTVLAGRFALVFNAGRVLGTTVATAAAAPLTLYPNPAANHSALRVTGAPAGNPLTLLDATGRAIVTVSADATGAATVPVRGLAGGVYVLRAPDGRTARLVVE